MSFVRVNRKRPCPLCRRPDWCLIAANGEISICMRVSENSAGVAKGGGFVHVLGRDSQPQRATALSSRPAVPQSFAQTRTSAELDAVYTAFLNNLELAPAHQSSLLERGLDLPAQSARLYRSMPERETARDICRELADDFNLWHVPGFYYREGNWRFVDYGNATGFLIPLRNSGHEIVGLQLRRDDDRKPKYMLISSTDKPRGASSGTPVHFAIPPTDKISSFDNEKVAEIIITEGALKADVISFFLNQPIVALTGVGCFDERFPELLNTAFPQLSKVSIAFDMDAWHNPAVRHQRERLTALLRPFFATTVITWNPEHKGLDDYLLSQQPAPKHSSLKPSPSCSGRRRAA